MNLLGESTLKFCEYYITGNEIYNSLSFIFLFIVGLYIFLRRKSYLDVQFAVILILISLFTLVFHLSERLIGQSLDFSSMYLITLLSIKLNLDRKGINFHYLKYLTVYLVITSITFIFSTNFEVSIIFFFLLFLIAVLTFSFNKGRIKRNRQRVYLLFSLVLLLTGFIFWNLDYNKILCIESLLFINGHVIWHFFSAFSYYFVWRLYKLT